MKRLLIAGAGGFGREVLQWALDMQNVEKRWDLIGFLNDDLSALDRFNKSNLIIGTITDYQPKANEEVACAIGDPITRYNVVNKLISKGTIFTNIIHPTAIISRDSSIGKGVIICPRVLIGPDSKISDFVVVNSMTTVAHDVILETFSTLSAHCDVMGNSYIGEKVFLGSSACILPSVEVGNNVKVGAGSIVIRNVKEGISVFGNPAKKILVP